MKKSGKKSTYVVAQLPQVHSEFLSMVNGNRVCPGLPKISRFEDAENRLCA